MGEENKPRGNNIIFYIVIPNLFVQLETLKQVQGDIDLFARFEIPKQSWIIGGSTGSTQLSPRRAGFTLLTRRTCQNPQFRMTFYFIFLTIYLKYSNGFSFAFCAQVIPLKAELLSLLQYVFISV